MVMSGAASGAPPREATLCYRTTSLTSGGVFPGVPRCAVDRRCALDYAMPLLRDVSDTARWAAMHRALESERPDALFRDPYARRLAGERGEQIVGQLEKTGPWAWALRTHLIDGVLLRSIESGADTVVNLAAGLDARPYRMALPPALRWVEVDLPPIVQEKERALRGEQPACRLERVTLDLADEAERRRLFARIGGEAKRAVVVTEGLLVYLDPDQVLSLARDLAGPASFWRWTLDLDSPGLLRMLRRSWGRPLEDAHSPLKFGPPEGPAFFEPAGWTPVEVHSIVKTAAREKRIGLLRRLLARLPESSGRQGRRPWMGVCVLERRAPPAG